MIYREDNEFKLMPYEVSFTQSGEQQTNLATEKKTWQAYEELGHISGVTFTDKEYSPDQLSRLAEVKDFPESEFSLVEEYVVNGEVPEGSRLFDKKRIEALEAAQIELTNMILAGGLA